MVCSAAAADRWLRAGMNPLVMPRNKGDNDGLDVGPESLRPKANEHVIQKRASAASCRRFRRRAVSRVRRNDCDGDSPWIGVLGFRVMVFWVGDSACRGIRTGLKAMQGCTARPVTHCTSR